MLAKDHPLNRIWRGMRQRCLNPNATAYHRYGGRGITICAEWDDFWQFVADMGERPEGTTLDRTDNDGPYAPRNCRWSKQGDQQRNGANSRKLIYKGETLCVTDLAARLGVTQSAISHRLRRGWQP